MVEPKTFYLMFHEPYIEKRMTADILEAEKQEHVLKTFLRLRGCKDIYVNLTSYNYVLRIKYTPLFGNPDDIWEKIKQYVNENRCEWFNEWSEVCDYVKIHE